MRVTAGSSGGSGFIFATAGDTAFVVTNHHVIEDADAIDVTVKDARTYPATLLGFNSDKDVAVLAMSSCQRKRRRGSGGGAASQPTCPLTELPRSRPHRCQRPRADPAAACCPWQKRTTSTSSASCSSISPVLMAMSVSSNMPVQLARRLRARPPGLVQRLSQRVCRRDAEARPQPPLRHPIPHGECLIPAKLEESAMATQQISVGGVVGVAGPPSHRGYDCGNASDP